MEHHDSWEDKYYIYMDIQLKYYLDFFPLDSYIFILADHGYLGQIIDERIHIPLIIKTPKNDKMVIDELFSTKDILKVVRKIIDNVDVKIKNEEYIRIEKTPFYNKELIESYKVDLNSKYIYAFQMIKTIDEKYIIFQNGYEEYYVLSEDEMKEINVINNKKYIDKINNMRGIHKKIGFPKFN